MGLLNMGAGLSTMGAAVAQQAGAYGLDEEKAALETQQTQLASQLAGARESVGRAETAGYAATAAQKQQTFEAGQATQSQTAAAALAKGQEASAQQIATGQQETEKEVAGIDVTARSADVKAQIEAAGNQMGFDTNGNPQIINSVTGKVTPLLGADGKPISAMNPMMVNLAMKTMQDATQSLGQARVQYAADIRAAQDNVDRVLQTHPSMADPDVLAARKALQDVKDNYAPMFDNYNRQISNAAAILKGPNNEAPAPGTRPPLSSIIPVPGVAAPGGGTAPAPGLLNTPQ